MFLGYLQSILPLDFLDRSDNLVLDIFGNRDIISQESVEDASLASSLTSRRLFADSFVRFKKLQNLVKLLVPILC